MIREKKKKTESNHYSRNGPYECFFLYARTIFNSLNNENKPLLFRKYLAQDYYHYINFETLEHHSYVSVFSTLEKVSDSRAQVATSDKFYLMEFSSWEIEIVKIETVGKIREK